MVSIVKFEFLGYNVSVRSSLFQSWIAWTINCQQPSEESQHVSKIAQGPHVLFSLHGAFTSSPSLKIFVLGRWSKTGRGYILIKHCSFRWATLVVSLIHFITQLWCRGTCSASEMRTVLSSATILLHIPWNILSYPSGWINVRINTTCSVLIAIKENFSNILWQILCKCKDYLHS